MKSLKLAVLDQSVSLAGSSEDAAIRDTLSLAEHCEGLGYSRFWLSEHHGLPTIVGSAPEILMAAIAVNLDIEPVEKPETVRWIDPTHPQG